MLLMENELISQKETTLKETISIEDVFNLLSGYIGTSTQINASYYYARPPEDKAQIDMMGVKGIHRDRNDDLIFILAEGKYLTRKTLRFVPKKLEIYKKEGDEEEKVLSLIETINLDSIQSGELIYTREPQEVSSL